MGEGVDTCCLFSESAPSITVLYAVVSTVTLTYRKYVECFHETETYEAMSPVGRWGGMR